MCIINYFHTRGPGGMALPVVFIGALYIYLAISLQVLARKTGTKHGWMGWIPFLNLYLLCKIAGKPGWWLFMLLIPFVNLFFGIIVFMAIAEARHKPFWWGILIAIPVLRAAVPGYLAFSGPKAPVQTSAAG